MALSQTEVSNTLEAHRASVCALRKFSAGFHPSSWWITTACEGKSESTKTATTKSRRSSRDLVATTAVTTPMARPELRRRLAYHLSWCQIDSHRRISNIEVHIPRVTRTSVFADGGVCHRHQGSYHYPWHALAR